MKLFFIYFSTIIILINDLVLRVHGYIIFGVILRNNFIFSLLEFIILV